VTVPCTNPFDSTTAFGDEFGWQAATLVGANEKHVGLPTGEHPVIPTAFTRRKAARSAIAGTLPLPDHCPSLLHGPGALRACKTAILDGALPEEVSGVVDNGSVFSISPGARKSQPLPPWGLAEYSCSSSPDVPGTYRERRRYRPQRELSVSTSHRLFAADCSSRQLTEHARQ